MIDNLSSNHISLCVPGAHTRSFHYYFRNKPVSGNNRCKQCDLVFDTQKKFDAHVIFAHKCQPASVKKILILGGGFAGINVLNNIQKVFKDEKVSISLVNEENFFLFTPMLAEVAAKMMHPSNITIPIRNFCKNAKFYQATVSSIDLNQKLVTITRTFDGKVHALDYDYLVLALGSKNNFFGNRNMEKNSFTIKSIEDAIGLRNHAINMMEHAAQTGDFELQKKYLTFTVVGGGFAGVETIGEINHFVREAVKHHYTSIDESAINMYLISARDGILPEVPEKLGKVAIKYLKKVGVKVLTKCKAVDASEDHVEINDGTIIPCTTLIWAGGVAIDPVITTLPCEHGNGGKVLVDKYLKLNDYPEVFALGDCAAILDSATGKPYPPTAQHAIRESKVVSQNLKAFATCKGNLKEFSYQSKGMMATIGNRTGVVSIFGYSLTGFIAWFIWRSYYLSSLPTLEKKVKVALDWTVDLLFNRDVTLIGQIKKKELNKIHIGNVPSLKEQLFADL